MILRVGVFLNFRTPETGEVERGPSLGWGPSGRNSTGLTLHELCADTALNSPSCLPRCTHFVLKPWLYQRPRRDPRTMCPGSGTDLVAVPG